LPIDATLVEQLYRRAHAERWHVARDRFAEALERSAQHTADLRSLHLEDLALACGCAGGDDAAWEHFIREHRPTLYRAADALDPSGSARDLADSIYGDIFERSLFRYFHGRSSLSTWLRAVLAQRHVDRIRAVRRLEPLPDEDSASAVDPAVGPADAGAGDFERPRYFALMHNALQRGVEQLTPRERLRLACYYAQELTLAETGTLLGEHEATCSRQLARTRKVLRGEIERILRTEHRLAEADIAECVASVSEDAGPLDLRRLLNTAAPVEVRKRVPVDRSTVRGISGEY
jgi:RNA polymerase sigma-70 factor (ECF subfamily)